jgi:hypothetical protein
MQERTGGLTATGWGASLPPPAVPWPAVVRATFANCSHGLCMTPAPSSDERIAKMTFASVYPHYVKKVERKGRGEAELRQVIRWLTGFDDDGIDAQIAAQSIFTEFFAAARLHANAASIKGVVCGHRVEEITNPLTQKVRYLDKLVDELAKGKAMEKILRA